MPFCPECGTAHQAGARFCANCGAKLGAAAGSPAPAPSSPKAPVTSSAPKYTTTTTTGSPSTARVPVGQSQTGAFHGPSYGLDAELQAKQAAKYDTAGEQAVRQWMASKGVPVSGDFHSELKNGVKLCELANKLQPGLVPKIQKSNAPFVQMENISAFLKALSALGVQTHEQFQTVDLYEAKNMGAVLVTLLALKRVRP